MSLQRDRTVHLTMTVLDQEMEDQNLNDGAYLRLSNALMAIKEANEAEKRGVITQYLLRQICWKPLSAASVPLHERRLIERPEFIHAVFKKRTTDAETKYLSHDAWKEKLLRGLFCPVMLDEEKKSFSYQWFRDVLLAVLRARCNMLEPLEKFLNEKNISPFHAHFPMGDGRLDECPEVLLVEPGFLWWLLNPEVYDRHTFEQWEVLKLQEYAFRSFYLQLALPPEKRPEVNELKFIAALGLRGRNDVVAIQSRMRIEYEKLGHPNIETRFAEVKALVLAAPYDGTPEALPPRPFQATPYPWDL